MLQDWNDGAIKYFTQPPREAAEVTIVSELAAEFDRAQAPRVELTASAETKPFVFAPADPRGTAGAGGEKVSGIAARRWIRSAQNAVLTLRTPGYTPGGIRSRSLKSP